MMTLALGGVVPVLQLKKQARKKLIRLLKVTIPLWHTILAPDSAVSNNQHLFCGPGIWEGLR